MTYASEDALDIYLEMNEMPVEVKGSVLARAYSMINDELGFVFGGDAVQRTFTVGAETDTIWLPSPGAQSVTLVTEDGVDLDTDGTAYELDPDTGAFILRLDSGEAAYWTEGNRIVTVVYTPTAAPDSLVQAELVEAVRIWRGKTAGYSGVIGVEGVNELKYDRAFAPSTWRTIEKLQAKYGQTATAFSGGGWVIR